jgi:hypothetical protein
MDFFSRIFVNLGFANESGEPFKEYWRRDRPLPV